MKGAFFGYQYQRERLLTFGLGIMILQGVSSRKSLAGVNIMIGQIPLYKFQFIMSCRPAILAILKAIFGQHASFTRDLTSPLTRAIPTVINYLKRPLP
jgi:hypothetical protein